jgi:hypothetical protein
LTASLNVRQIERGALMIQFAIVTLLAFLASPLNALAQSCAGDPVAVQILGSGGQRTNPDRASSSYVLWIDAQARILVRFDQAPPFPVFLARLFDEKNGAFPLLAPTLGGAQADHG